MPPSAVKTYHDLVCYEWAKAIARSAGMKDKFPFIMNRMKKLKCGELHMSDIVREDRIMAVEGRKECAYCAAQQDLSWDHLIPTSKGGPNVISNTCQPCGAATCAKENEMSWSGTALVM